MTQTPGYWTYALATGAAIALELALASLLKIRGHADVALMIGIIAAAVYAVTPAHQRGEAKRLWLMIFLALGAMMLASGLGALWGVAMAPFAFAPAIREGASPHPLTGALVLGAAVVMAAGAYLALFRAGWPYVKPPEAPAPAAPASAYKRLFG